MYYDLQYNNVSSYVYVDVHQCIIHSHIHLQYDLKTKVSPVHCPFQVNFIVSQSLIGINFSLQYSTQISTFSEKAKAIILSMDPTNELYYLRVTSRKHEILVAPDNDFVLIVLQSPSAE